MITTRLALVLIRMVLTLVALTYAVLKLFVEPRTTPLFGLPMDAAVNLPIDTNPAFAISVILFSIAVSGTLLITTSHSIWTEFARYGHLAPFSSPLQIALLSIFACISTYYFVIAVLADGRWYYSATLAVVAVILAIYEGRQYADFNQVKVHPVDH